MFEKRLAYIAAVIILAYIPLSKSFLSNVLEHKA